MNNNTTTQINHDMLAPPGIQGHLIIVDSIQEETRSSEAQISDTTLREFEVKAALAKYNPFLDSIEFAVTDGQGESYFLVPTETEIVNVATPEGPFSLYKNQRNELATIAYRCIAPSWQEAFRKFIAGITPFLDTLCYHADAPVVIQRLYCIDSANRVSVASYRSPYAHATVNPHEGEIPRELIPVYALYREATNSQSNYYRFLCYYKILEGIFSHLRPQLMQKARSQNIKISTRRETVPQHAELVADSSPYVGQSIHTLFKDEFTPQYRDAVAHFALDSGTLLNVNDYISTARFTDIILVSQVCAREVISTQEDYYNQFYRQGGTD